MPLLQAKWYTCYQEAAVAVTLCVLEGRFLITSLFKYDLWAGWASHSASCGSVSDSVVSCSYGCRCGAATVDQRRPIWAYSVTRTAWHSSVSLAPSPIHVSSRMSSSVRRPLQWIHRTSAASGEASGTNVDLKTSFSKTVVLNMTWAQ